MENPSLVLVDGSSYLYRAFYALPSLSNSRGEPTGAIFGVANMLRRLQKDFDTNSIVVVFDARGKTFRDDLYKQYKANRPPMPDDLRSQVEPLIELVSAMGFPLLRVSGVEADDVIGTLASRAAREKQTVMISTGDKDIAQLVNKSVYLVNTMTGTKLDEHGVKEKFGVAPGQMVDYLALIGDTSDNIPGVPGIGPKTAAPLLEHFGTLDALYARIEETRELGVRGAKKLPEKLLQHREQTYLSRDLATIRCDLDLDITTGELQMSAPDVSSLRKLYRNFEFRSWLEQMEDEVPEETAVIKDAAVNYDIILDEKQLDVWLQRIHKAKLFSFDTETTSLDYMNAEIVGISFAIEPNKAAYVPLAHKYPDAPEQLSRDTVLEKFRNLLESDNHPKVGHHIKYDAHVLLNHGVTLRGMMHDTMLESYIFNSTATRHDMDSVALRYLNHRTVKYADVAGKGVKQKRFDEIDISTAGPYAAEDADITLRLHQALWPELQKEKSLCELYETVEIPLLGCLLRMEHHGVLVDVKTLAEQSTELEKAINELEQQAYKISGDTFNLRSPKQLQTILFDKLSLPVIRKTPKGQPSTAEDVLQEMAHDYELPDVILRYRGLSKLKSTYTDRLPEQVNARTGRVHTSYHQAVASTGRLSSTDPNLQNIPIRTEEGRRVRRAFIAPEGYQLLAADYSQIELRIMAHLSGDSGLIRAFEEDRDIHRATAAEVFGCDLDTVTDEQRRSAKAINFGLIYGMSAFGLARQLKIDRRSAQEYVDLYFDRYPDVKTFMDSTREQARKIGYVETVFGRRLYLPDINARKAQVRQYAERTAINAPMQGTAADIIKRAMIAIDCWLAGSGLAARMIMQVHDELVFEVLKQDLDRLEAGVREHMCAAAQLKVPLKVDVGIGANWDEAH
ncbi:MAG: DNA polymerase I [Gammaproteobacteria bacterium]